MPPLPGIVEGVDDEVEEPPARTHARRIGEAVEAHRRDAQRDRQVVRPGVGAHRERRAVQEPEEPPQIVPALVHYRNPRQPDDFERARPLGRSVRADDADLVAQVPVERFGEPRPALGRPLLRAPRRTHDERRKRRAATAVERGLGGTLLGADR